MFSNSRALYSSTKRLNWASPGKRSAQIPPPGAANVARRAPSSKLNLSVTSTWEAEVPLFTYPLHSQVEKVLETFHTSISQGGGC